MKWIIVNQSELYTEVIMETTKSIVQLKSAFSLSEWQVQVTACQESGKTVKAWCEENGISPATYYNRLRKLREAALSEEEHRLVPINPTPSRNIKISAGEISISLPDDATPEQLSAILGVLKSC